MKIPYPIPKLLIITDVSAERTGANALLLYRLFKDYPPEYLRVIHGRSETCPDPTTRLPNVPYHRLALSLPKYICNRFNRPVWPLFMARHAARSAQQALALLGEFEPDALVSVANGYLWFTADAISHLTGTPLHLFLHEDWTYLATNYLANRANRGIVASIILGIARRLIRPIIRRAASRFSVSPGMAEEIYRNYGVSSELLYPNRGDDSPVPRVRVRAEQSIAPIIAHSGWVHLRGNAALLREVARMVGSDGGHLDLYTMHDDADLLRLELTLPIVRRIGYFPAFQMGERLGETAHALILTASFDLADRTHESTLFPSKLADYTAVGLPIVIWGPSYSSAVRWGTANPGAALVFTSPDPGPVGAALRRFAADPDYSARVAAAGIEVGRRYFEFSPARDLFFDALFRRV